MSIHAVAAAAVVLAFAAGVWAVAASFRPAPAGRPTRGRTWPTPLRLLTGADLPATSRRRHRQVLIGAVTVGAVLWLVTGWVIAVIAVPAAALGLPALLRAPRSGTDLEMLTALETWTRGLSGVLTVGAGIEHAITHSLPGTPEPLRPAVTSLVARLRARWTTADALRAFADDLDDATGDLVASALILGTTLRDHGLAKVLNDLAGTVAEEVRLRRQIEADRAKPRTTARWTTLITLAVMAMLVLDGTYIAPYASGLGQLTLAVLLTAYVGALIWMRHMSIGDRTPRFLPTTITTTAGPSTTATGARS